MIKSQNSVTNSLKTPFFHFYFYWAYVFYRLEWKLSKINTHYFFNSWFRKLARWKVRLSQLKSSFVQPEITMTADNGESFADKGLRPADNNYWSDAGIFSRHDPRRTWRLSTLTAKICCANMGDCSEKRSTSSWCPHSLFLPIGRRRHGLRL